MTETADRVKAAARIRVRPATPADLSFLERMLVEAGYWRGDAPATVEEALARPDLAALLRDWGRSGDLGVVATDPTGIPVGAAWFREWTEDRHSYGFIDAGTPELAIGVVFEWRGRGVGSALLDSLLRAAGEAGYRQLSLSVEIDNPARRLYERKGFERHATVGGAWTMRVAL